MLQLRILIYSSNEIFSIHENTCLNWNWMKQEIGFTDASTWVQYLDILHDFVILSFCRIWRSVLRVVFCTAHTGVEHNESKSTTALIRLTCCTALFIGMGEACEGVHRHCAKSPALHTRLQYRGSLGGVCATRVSACDGCYAAFGSWLVR